VEQIAPRRAGLRRGQAAVETESMTFESVAAELQFKQQAADLVRVYPV